jgi:rubrerythrin
MEKGTKDNIYKAFVGEAKAYFRLLAYAEKAREENEPQIALLFKAVAEAERVHATRHLNLVKDVLVKDTDRKKTAKMRLPRFSAMPGMPKPIMQNCMKELSTT